MTSGLGGVKVAILGGDAREVFLAGYLAKAGFFVKAVGLFAQGENITSCQDPAEGLQGVQVVILPVPGI
jgi:hypothetical protein